MTRKQQLKLIRRYYSDTMFREAMPCSECGKTGGCAHFPKEVTAVREP